MSIATIATTMMGTTAKALTVMAANGVGTARMSSRTGDPASAA